MIPVIARRSALLAAAALLALAAALALAPHSSSAPPDDLELILSLSNDADNVVPPDSTITVAASLRHSGIGENIEIDGGTLRTAGNYEFEGAGRARVSIAEQQVGAAPWRGSGAAFGDRFGAFGGAILDGDTFFIKSLRNDFANGRWATAEGKFYVYDVPSRTEVAIIEPPAGAEQLAWGRGFAAYHEDADTGWIFVGSFRDTVTVTGAQCGAFRLNAQNRRYWANLGTQCEETGRLYIYKYDKSASDPADWTVELAATIAPSAADASYRETATRAAKTSMFGIDVKLSDDGQTLVVGSPRMDIIGAMLVFSKPSSTGSWGDLTYANGVKLSPTAIPAEQTIESSAPNKAKSYGGRLWSTGRDGSGFGEQVQISGDGSVIASGTFKKRYDDNNQLYSSNGCPGSYWEQPKCVDVGEVTVFVRPSGGWAADTTPNARLLITPEVQQQRLGQYLAISHDGATIAASAAQRPQPTPDWPGKVFLWNRPSGGWTADITGAHATLTAADGRNGDQFGHIGTDFNHDGSKLVVSNHKYQDADRAAGDTGTSNSNAGFFGRAWLFSGTNGAWTSATTAAAAEIVSPQPRASALFGVARFAEDGRKVIIGQTEDAAAANVETGPGAVWLFDEDLTPLTFAGSTCEVDSGILLDDSADDINTCPLNLPAQTEIVIPAGTPDGAITLSGAVTVDGQTYRGTVSVRIRGDIKEVARTTFDFATDDRGTRGIRDDRPWPDTISPGQSTVLRLSVLSETDHAPPAGSIGSILLSTTVGSLSTNINDGERAPAAFSTSRRNHDGCIRTGGFTCQVKTDALNSDNADEILVTLTAPRDAKAGRAVVTARVISAAGDTFTATRSVSITGPFHTLEIAEPSTGILNVGTPDAGADRDDRDLLYLAVAAQDAAGNSITVPDTASLTHGGPRAIPTHRLTIIAPDGKRNPAGISARWARNPFGQGLAVDAAGNPLIEIDVDAVPSAALRSGEYTLEARVNRQNWSRAFRVGGGPAAIAFDAPASVAILNARISVTVTVTDAEGLPVVDGTPVTFSEQRIGINPVLVLLSPATQRTSGGKASVEMLVVNAGGAYVKATAGGIANLQPVRSAAAPVAPATTESLSVTARNSFTTWLSERPVSASSLLSALTDVSGVWLWTGERWVGYSIADGLLVPGSTDFNVELGSILWLSSNE